MVAELMKADLPGHTKTQTFRVILRVTVASGDKPLTEPGAKRALLKGLKPTGDVPCPMLVDITDVLETTQK